MLFRKIKTFVRFNCAIKLISTHHKMNSHLNQTLHSSVFGLFNWASAIASSTLYSSSFSNLSIQNSSSLSSSACSCLISSSFSYSIWRANHWAFYFIYSSYLFFSASASHSFYFSSSMILFIQNSFSLSSSASYSYFYRSLAHSS